MPIKGHRPRACGWEEYLPLNLNRRSGARHQPLPYWQFLDRTPYIICFSSAPLSQGRFRGDTIDFAYGFARYDVFQNQSKVIVIK